MIYDKLHVVFHDLTGPIGSINTLSQICAAYITQFNLEKLQGKYEKEIASTFKNISSYHNIIVEKLKLVVGALTEFGERDIALALQKDILREVEKIKDLEASADLLYSRLLKADTKDNLCCFSKEVSKFNVACGLLSKIINDCKDKLTALGKY